jgi:hypothetical protein
MTRTDLILNSARADREQKEKTRLSGHSGGGFKSERHFYARSKSHVPNHGSRPS